MSFDTRLLTGVGVLAAVNEAGNFARAAEIVGLTPSGVSRAVARLEARVGVRLFDRSPRSVTLTEEGRRFHAQVMPLLAGLEEAATDAAGAAIIVNGRLRVSVDPWFNRMVLAPHLPRFKTRHLCILDLRNHAVDPFHFKFGHAFPKHGLHVVLEDGGGQSELCGEVEHRHQKIADGDVKAAVES